MLVGAGREQRLENRAAAGGVAACAGVPGGWSVQLERRDPQRRGPAEVAGAAGERLERALPGVADVVHDHRRGRDAPVRVGAGREQRLDQPQPAVRIEAAPPELRVAVDVVVAAVPVRHPREDAAGGGVQGRHPRHHPVGVGAALDQEERELVVAGDDGVGQGVGVVGARLVGVDAGREQRIGHRHVAVAGRVEQRREPLGGRRVGVGARVEQGAHHRGMRPRHRPHQGRAPGLAGRGVDVGPGREQGLGHGHASGPRRRHQRGQAARARNVRAGARRQQALDHREAGILGRPLEGGHAVVVGRVHVGAGPDEPAREVRVVPVGRPQQGRRPVGARRVDVGAGVEQGPHRLRVLDRDGVDEPEILADDRAGRQHQTCDDDGDGHSLHGLSPPQRNARRSAARSLSGESGAV